MPKFVFNKLIRDKLRADYEKLDQRAVYKTLTPDEFIRALKHKIIEEANEIPVGGTKDNIASELADIQQVIEDLATSQGISQVDIQTKKEAKFNKKGGFSDATFVETLELADDDEWVEYYRKYPDVFKEIK